MPGVRSIERKTPAFVWPYAAAITFSLTDMFRKSRNVWNVREMPRWQILCGASPTIDCPSSVMSPLVRVVDAGDQVEERRLAGAVRPDHRDDLALLDVHVEVGDDLQPAERERDALQLEQRHQMISTRRSPSRPFGRRIISPIRISPSTM